MNTIRKIRITTSLILVSLIRFFCIFTVFPVLTSYGKLKNSSDFLVGISMGIYGLNQIIFQIPFNFLSCCIGYRKTIFFSLCIFCFGSFFPIFLNSIWGVIIGRAFQGSSVVSSLVMSCLFDILHDDEKKKITFLLGIGISFIFILSFVLSSIVLNTLGSHGLFFFIGFLSLLGVFLIYFLFPSDHNVFPKEKIRSAKESLKINFRIVFNYNVFFLNFSIFCLYCLLVCNFLTLPKKIENFSTLLENHWRIYLFILILSFTFSYFFFICIQKKIKKFFLFFIIILTTSKFILFFEEYSLTIMFGIQLFFTSFSVMEILLPFLINQISDQTVCTRSFYLISQYLGITVGGFLGGWILKEYGHLSLFFLEIVLFLLWVTMMIKKK